MRPIDGDDLVDFIKVLKKVCNDATKEAAPEQEKLVMAFTNYQNVTFDMIIKQIYSMPTLPLDMVKIIHEPVTILH